MLRAPVAFALVLTGPWLAGRPAVREQHAGSVRPEERVLGRDAEIKLPANTRALQESLASIARASGALIGFETVLDTDEGRTRTESGWRAGGQTVGEALDGLLALHPRYEWRSVNGVIHVRPREAVSDAGHFLNTRAAPLALEDALPLHATFEVHRVFIPDCVVRHPIYTDARDAYLEQEQPAMRRGVTLAFPGGTALELLDAVVKAHGSLYWNVTYRVPPEKLHEARPRYEYAIFSFAASPETGGWWRMCAGKHDDRP